MRAAPATINPDELLKQLEGTTKSNSPWIKYPCQLVTPLYGGGVKAGEIDVEMPIRASEIRGQLRFWWRVACGPFSSSQEMFRRESDIWGGIGSESAVASNVEVRVVQEGNGKLMNSADEKHPAIKYAFGPAAQNGATWLAAGYKFTLQLRYPEEVAEEVDLALRWWANFGGLGARTRRGFGAVEVEGLTTVAFKELTDAGCILARAPLAETTALAAWKTSNQKLHHFRQGRGFARAQGSERPGRSYWPEPDQLRRDTGKNDNGRHMPEHASGNVFPRASFGLPIIFDFRKPTEPMKTELLPAGDKDRMASPLILRPCLNEGQWFATALLLPTWKSALRQPLRYKNGSGAPVVWPQTESESQQKGVHIKPMKENCTNGKTDPLSAFMNYFKKGQQ